MRPGGPIELRFHAARQIARRPIERREPVTSEKMNNRRVLGMTQRASCLQQSPLLPVWRKELTTRKAQGPGQRRKQEKKGHQGWTCLHPKGFSALPRAFP